MTARHAVPPGATRVMVAWEHEDQSLTVEGFLYPAFRGSRMDPPEPATLDLVAVYDATGTERPELLPEAERDLDAITEQAEEDEAGRYEAAIEARADAARDDRMCGER